MTYPIINGSEINGAEGGATDFSLRPVTFGVPVIPVDLAAFASPISPVILGVHEVSSLEGYMVDAASLSPVRFSAHGLTVGMPPTGVSVGADSLQPVQVGVPGVVTAFSAAASSLSVASIGVAGLDGEYAAVSLAPTSFGTHGLQIGMPSADGLSPVSFGIPLADMGFVAISLYPVSLGAPQIVFGETLVDAASLSPVSIGIPGTANFGAPAYSLRPARIGVPTIYRGATC